MSRIVIDGDWHFPNQLTYQQYWLGQGGEPIPWKGSKIGGTVERKKATNQAATIANLALRFVAATGKNTIPSWFSINVGAVCGNETRMSKPSRSRSSIMGDEGYFDWRENMERPQRESEWQVQALLQETRRLRKENEVLQFQASSSGPPHSQQPRSRWTNSSQNEEAWYPGNAESLSNEYGIRPYERPLPPCHAPQDQSSDSTRVSSKRRRDRKSQLSDTMCVRPPVWRNHV